VAQDLIRTPPFQIPNKDLHNLYSSTETFTMSQQGVGEWWNV